jgi:hypothetical protein
MDLVAISASARVDSCVKLLLCKWRALDWIEFDTPFDIRSCNLASSLLHFVAHGVRRSGAETTVLTDALRLEVNPPFSDPVGVVNEQQLRLVACKRLCEVSGCMGCDFGVRELIFWASARCSPTCDRPACFDSLHM